MINGGSWDNGGRAAVVALQGPTGEPLRAGFNGQTATAQTLVIGYDGRAFISKLVARNMVTVELAEGVCHGRLPLFAERRPTGIDWISNMPMTGPRAFLAIAALVVLAGGDAHAALSCGSSLSTLPFGSVNVTTSSSATATGTITITCSGLASAATVYMCVGLGADNNGLATGATNRRMTSGTNTLVYGTYTDATYATGWGSWSWTSGGSSGKVISLAVPANASASTSATIYARLGSSQSNVAGSYGSIVRSNLSTPSTTAITSCIGQTTSYSTNIVASATLSASCTVSASTLNFGNVGLLTSEVNSSTSLSVRCTSGTAYTIGLDGGVSGATDPSRREMTKGSESITYGLYRDVSGSLPFGSISGTNTYSGTGTGLAQAVPVYGLIPAQKTPTPGLFSDTIVATVTY